MVGVVCTWIPRTEAPHYHWTAEHLISQNSPQTLNKLSSAILWHWSLLVELRNTPLQEIGFSPAQLLVNRRTQGKLPINNNLLKPQVTQNVQNLWERIMSQYKSQHAHGTTEPLLIVQSMWLKEQPQLKNATWLEGKASIDTF